MNSKRILAGLAALLMALTVTACGKQEEQVEEPAGEQVLTETVPETEAEETETEEETEAPTEKETEAPTEAETETETETVAETETETTAATEAPTQAPTQAPTEAPKEEPAPTEAEQPAYHTEDPLTFVFGNQPIRLGDNAKTFTDAVRADSIEAAPSCMGNGEDINYYYDDFTIYVWNENGNYLTYGIDLTGMGVSTSRGIMIGSTANDVTAAYGGEYTVEGDDYVYTFDGCTLRFTILNGEVHYISYNKEL